MKYIRNIIGSIKNRKIGAVEDDVIRFTCNICGASAKSRLINLSREESSCHKCGSTVRMRAIVHILSMELFDKSMVLKDFPQRKDIKGIGMSDWDGYARVLSRKLNYTNTYYHQEPKLDITDIPDDLIGTMDFIISSDVYEHVLFPVSRAFENARKLLKDSGVFIITVPYTKEGDSTIEHFGQLNDFEIMSTNGNYILTDKDETGNERQFHDLVFHGGPGSTLEMRVFSEKSLTDELKNSGFEHINIYSEQCMEYGIHWDVDWSLPIAARP